MKFGIHLVAGLFLLACSSLTALTEPFKFSRAQPEAEGVSSTGLLAFVEALDRVEGLHSVMLVRHGAAVADYLSSRLFEPLGITHLVWNTNFQGISLGGYGLSVRTEDIARFGQFLLQKGRWNNRQLLPADWIELATSRQVSNGSDPKSDWDQGYGFQFWRCQHHGDPETNVGFDRTRTGSLTGRAMAEEH